jgi:hypothetical protein
MNRDVCCEIFEVFGLFRQNYASSLLPLQWMRHVMVRTDRFVMHYKH